MNRKLYLEFSHGKWYAVRHVSVEGKVKKRYESLGIEGKASKRTAEKAFHALEMREAIAVANGRGYGREIAVVDFAEEFLATAQLDVRPSTYRSYSLWVRRFSLVFGAYALGELEAQHIEAWKRDLAQKLSPSSVNIALRSVRVMFGRAVRQRVIPHSPFDAVGMADVPRPDFPPYWNDGQFRELLQHVTSKRLRVGFSLAFYAGLRARECVTLQWIDVREDSLQIVSREGARTKSGKSRVVPLFDKLRAELDLLPHRGSYVLSSKYQDVSDERTLSQKFLYARRRLPHLPDINFHALRHSFATGCAFRGMPLPVLQQIMGHASITTTAMYMHVQGEDAARAAQKYAP